MLRRVDKSKLVKTVIGSEDEFFINLHGIVKDKLMDNVEVNKDEDGYDRVFVKYLGKFDNYRIVDLIATHFKFLDLYLTEDELKSVIGFKINEDVCYPNDSHNVGYRFKGGKLECSKRKGFYFVPGFPSRAINEVGDMISTVDGDYRKWGIQQPGVKKNITGGYRVNNAYMLGKRHVISRHRSMLLVFREYPNNVDTMLSNHENGIPGDDRLDNLSWVTHAENNNHAFATGLRSQNKPVLLRNVNTGIVKEYYSVASCARDISISDRVLNHRLEHKEFGFTDNLGYQIKYVSDNRDWPQ